MHKTSPSPVPFRWNFKIYCRVNFHPNVLSLCIFYVNLYTIFPLNCTVKVYFPVLLFTAFMMGFRWQLDFCLSSNNLCVHPFFSCVCIFRQTNDPHVVLQLNFSLFFAFFFFVKGLNTSSCNLLKQLQLFSFLHDIRNSWSPDQSNVVFWTVITTGCSIQN